MYRPDPFIVRELRRLEKTLCARWNNEAERWEVWDVKPLKYNHGWFLGESLGEIRETPYCVFRVQGPAGEYRPLDMRVVAHMAMLKAVRNGGYREMLRVMDEHNQRLDEKKKNAMAERIGYQTKQDFRYWQKQMSDDWGITSSKENNNTVYMGGHSIGP